MRRHSTEPLNFRSLWFPGIVFLSVLLAGCQDLGLRSPFLQTDQVYLPDNLHPLVIPSTQDLAYLSTLGKEADNQLLHCQSYQECDTAHFIRALTFLPEQEDLALQHFQKVAISPTDSNLARSSRVWIWVLESTQPSNRPSLSMAHFTQDLLQALLTKDLALARTHLLEQAAPSTTQVTSSPLELEGVIKTLGAQIQGLAHEVASFQHQSSAIQNLRKEIDARDKKVEELTLQLDALRQIDQELKKKSTPTRLSETLIPLKDNHVATP